MEKNIKKQESKSTALDTKKLLKQQKVSKFFTKTFVIVFLTIMSVLVVIPFYWMLNTSFKTGEEQDRLTPTLYPHEWTFENYKVAFLGKRYVKIQKYEKWINENPGKIKALDDYLKDPANLNKKNEAILNIEELDKPENTNLKYKDSYLPILEKFKYFEENDNKIKLLNDEETNIISRTFDIDKEISKTTDETRKNELKQEKANLEKRKLQIIDEKKKIQDEKKTDKYLNLIEEERRYIQVNKTKYTERYQGYLDIRDDFNKKNKEKSQLDTDLKNAQSQIKIEKNSSDDSFKVYIFHTLVVGISSTIIGTFISIIGAFALSRLSFKGKNLVFTIMLSTMMIPGEMMVISNYITVSKFNWIETSTGTTNHLVYLAMIVPFLVTVFHIYLLRQTFKQIPDELYYAAKVDGTSDFKYLWKIMVPLAKSSIITIVILKLMGTWNAYIWPNLVSKNHKLITVWLRTAFTDTEAGRTALELQMAATVLVLLPLLFVFIFLRKYIMRGVSRGGTKG